MLKLNWGIIGLGNIANVFCESFSEVNNANLLGISSNNLEKLEKFKKKFNIVQKYCFTNYNDLISCKEIDIVYIALPTTFHYEWIIKCIENKKNILVEKPATLNFQQMQNVKEKLSKTRLFFAEAFAYRFHPKIRKIIKIIKQNKIGKVHTMESVFGNNLLTKKKFFFFEKQKKIDPKNRLFNKELGGGVILDLGCYPVSLSILIASLLNNIVIDDILLTDVRKFSFYTGVDIDSSVNLVFNKSFNAKIHASFKKSLGDSTKITGDKGSLTIKDIWSGNSNLIEIHGVDNYVEEIKIEKNFYSYQLENISNSCLNNNKEMIYPGMKVNETLLNMKIIDQWLYE